VGGRVANPENAHAAGIGKALADTATDETARDDAQPLGIEVAQIDDIDRHGAKLAWTNGLCRPPARCGFPAGSGAPHSGPRKMPAQIRLFLCLKDNFGVLLHDPESGSTAA